MNQNKPRISHLTIEQSIKARRINEALDALAQLIAENSLEMFSSQLDNCRTAYSYLTRYLCQGVNDPQQKRVYAGIVNDIYRLNDMVNDARVEDKSGSQYFNTRRLMKYQNLSIRQLTDTYVEVSSQLTQLLSVPEPERNGNACMQTAQHLWRTSDNIFNCVWTLPTNDIETFNDTVRLYNDFADEPLRRMILGAVTLSVLRCFDKRRIEFLFDVYADPSSSDGAAIQALVGIFVAAFRHTDRFNLSTSIGNRMKQLADSPNAINDIKRIIIQFMKSADAERLNQRFNDELLPELKKISPKIFRKLKGSNINEMMDSLEQNPEWEKIFESTNITDKLIEFNKIQQDGGDVYLSLFSKFGKGADFEHMSKWFTPFDRRNPELLSVGNKKLIDVIDAIPNMCDCDKYAIIGTLSHPAMPSTDSFLSQFEAYSAECHELKASETESQRKTRDLHIMLYIQTLYRVFTFARYHQELFDLFAQKPFINENAVVDIVRTDADFITSTAEFYFSGDYYDCALSLYAQLINLKKASSMTYQKIGFCHQNMGRYAEALDAYKKADILSPDNIWVINHIAQCFKFTDNRDGALQYYRKADELKPDNIRTILNIGHLLLLADKTDEALKYYYKADYLSGGTARTIRPIAWAEFAAGNFEQSATYYSKIKPEETTAQDWLNMGHLNLATGNMAKAADCYQKCFSALGCDCARFSNDLLDDSDTLAKHGVDTSVLPIIIDYVCATSNNN